jgi:hypothetical protein
MGKRQRSASPHAVTTRSRTLAKQSRNDHELAADTVGARSRQALVRVRRVAVG